MKSSTKVEPDRTIRSPQKITKVMDISTSGKPKSLNSKPSLPIWPSFPLLRSYWGESACNLTRSRALADRQGGDSCNVTRFAAFPAPDYRSKRIELQSCALQTHHPVKLRSVAARKRNESAGERWLVHWFHSHFADPPAFHLHHRQLAAFIGRRSRRPWVCGPGASAENRPVSPRRPREAGSTASVSPDRAGSRRRPSAVRPKL